MKPACDREVELLELIGTGVWPDRADDDLRAHVERCEYCSELATVVLALSRAPAPAAPSRIPDARLVWHRAQMQARAESARRAARPVVYAQIAMGAIVLVLVILWTDSSWLLSRIAGDAESWTSTAQNMAAPLQRVFEPIASLVPGDASLSSPLVYAFAGVVGLGVLVLVAAAGLSRLIDRWS
jgi:hypothetical protein